MPNPTPRIAGILSRAMDTATPQGIASTASERAAAARRAAAPYGFGALSDREIAELERRRAEAALRRAVPAGSGAISDRERAAVSLDQNPWYDLLSRLF